MWKLKQQPIHSITNLSCFPFWPGCQEAQHLMRKLNHGRYELLRCAVPPLPFPCPHCLSWNLNEWSFSFLFFLAILSYKSSWILFRKDSGWEIRVIFHSLPRSLHSALGRGAHHEDNSPWRWALWFLIGFGKQGTPVGRSEVTVFPYEASPQ